MLFKCYLPNIFIATSVTKSIVSGLISFPTNNLYGIKKENALIDFNKLMSLLFYVYFNKLLIHLGKIQTHIRESQVVFHTSVQYIGNH